MEDLLSTPEGVNLQSSWDQANSEEDLQKNVNELIPLVLGTRDGLKGNYFDTHSKWHLRLQLLTLSSSI